MGDFIRETGRQTGRMVRPARRETGRAMVMVVDDEPLMRTVMKRVLVDEGYDVLTASTPREALSLAEHIARPDLVLTDLCMPGMNGFELVARLREVWPGIPAVFMSGASESGLPIGHDPGERQQRDVVLEKPFEIEALVSCVGEVLARALAH
jgi:two-component system, cell cycle sensor histidine kinase and response regulator CckA